MITKEECLNAYKELCNVLVETDYLEGRAICTYPIMENEIGTFYELIKEHFDNPPLKFEELEVMKPYWNNKEKEWCYFTILHNDLKTGVKITISSPPLMSAFKFEENTFYRKEVG